QYSQSIHLRHLIRHLGDLADRPCDRIGARDLDAFLQTRLAERDPSTVGKERITLMQFYKWVVCQSYLNASPAASLAPLKGGKDRPEFRPVGEIDRIQAGGGLTEEEMLALWECLSLPPEEIAGLLATVRPKASDDLSFPLHAIPAYTGLRRGEVLR